jgi:hypothetical protein
MSGDNNFLEAVHFCFISIFEGGIFCFVSHKCTMKNGSKIELKAKKKDQGPVVQKPINANLGLNLLNLGLNFNPRLLCVVQS